MADELTGITVAFLVAPEGVEQVELTEPWKVVEATGGTAKLVSTGSGTVQAYHHLDRADTFPVDATVDSVSVDDFDALVLPGGLANPDALRMNSDAVAFARGFVDAGKPVAAICHAPWTLIEADVVRDRTLTSWPSLQTDVKNAGGTWVDEEVSVDSRGPNTLITSRNPDDLPAFNATLVTEFARAQPATR
ncbi:type 1 glutamine amidotransferase domain-containing protein [Gordonia sp. CPCC 205515]|uniref:type 1 glutamine amidotransferase domain-containing protein n=1 Tax=Gordonia sp. CPCC 205515 TaxID=3140791 RepID=UPI003AF397EF